MTAGLGFPAEWWTPVADVAMRDGTPREALFAVRLGREVQPGTKGSTQVAGL